ncbi:MAG: hypothetical protein WC708_03945 [Lentisphaeria bacterium]
MKTWPKMWMAGVAALLLAAGAVCLHAEDATPKKPARVPYCYVDKDLNGKCDRSHLEGGNCPQFHARALTDKEKKKLEQRQKKAPAGDPKTMNGCPGQGLCLTCGLCAGRA